MNLPASNQIKKYRPSAFQAATFITLLFHVSGCIGMFTSHRQWFIDYTPLNLLIVFILVLLTQKKNWQFFIFVIACFVVGILVEMIGIHTGILFGNYEYGEVLGPKINGVPWLIGINWFVIVYCSGVIVTRFHNWVTGRYASYGRSLPSGLMLLSFVVDAAFLTVFFDWIMEPVAVELGFWTWAEGVIPAYNYLCWFIISGLLQVVFRLLRFDKQNLFAVHLFIIQLLFFAVLRTFL